MTDEKHQTTDERRDVSPRDSRPSGQYDEPEKMGVGRYLATRLSSLKPPMHKIDNPIAIIRLVNRHVWLHFACSFIAWTWDAFDFFSVSLTVSDLATAFNKSNADITWGITLVLMFRSLGAATFGLAADRWGRKWPFVVNNILFIALELGTGFCQTYKQFLACRALFGIAMGGLYGNVAAQALEDCPPRARGLLSGLLQQGYAFGYLLATVFARALIGNNPHHWRRLYWFGGAVPVLIIAFRLCLPETDAYQERMRIRSAHNNAGGTFIQEGKVALKRHWLLLIYLVLLMTGFNFMSHGSQDLYPTMLSNQYNFGTNAVTVTQVVANLGALCGGTTIGYLSQSLGRRFSIIVVCIVGGALLYPYSFVGSKKVMAAAFFEQFCVQGAWGVIPIHLLELSPGSLRAFVVGTSYQLGNLVSSASSTIEATIGERYPLPDKIEHGKHIKRYQYGKVICILMGCVYAYTIILTFLGPERLGRSLDPHADQDLVEAAGIDAVEGAKTSEPKYRESRDDRVEAQRD